MTWICPSEIWLTTGTGTTVATLGMALVTWICPSEIWLTTGADEAAGTALVTWICPSEIWLTTGADEAAAGTEETLETVTNWVFCGAVWVTVVFEFSGIAEASDSMAWVWISEVALYTVCCLLALRSV